MLGLIAAVVVFANAYLPGTDLPAYTGDVFAAHPAVGEHGIVITTNEWNRFSVYHSFTTSWVDNRPLDKRPHIATVTYDVALRFRLTDNVFLRVEHESVHNTDSYQGPQRRGNSVGMSWRVLN